MRVLTLSCPGCGGRTLLQHGENDVVCAHCSTVTSRATAVIQQRSDIAGHPTSTLVTLGAKAMIGGEEYEVIGRAVLGQTTDEGLYTWEEWLLAGEQGGVQYLEFDEGKWKLSSAFVPKRPVSPDEMAAMGAGSMIDLGEGPALVQEVGVYKVLAVEGEFHYPIARGDEKHFLDANRLGHFYSAEWGPDIVEFYRGEYMSDGQVYTLLGLREAVRALDARERVLAGRRATALAWLGAAAVCFMLWMAALGSGQEVPGAGGSLQLARAGEEGYRHGPFRLDAAGKIHRLILSGRMSQESVWVGAVLEDSAGVQLAGANQDMWDESGYDSDGSWHESVLKGQADFVLSKAGEYYVRIYAEPEAGRQVSENASVSWTVRKNAIYPVYLGWYGIIAAILGVCCLIAGSPQQVSQALQKAAESSDDD